MCVCYIYTRVTKFPVKDLPCQNVCNPKSKVGHSIQPNINGNFVPIRCHVLIKYLKQYEDIHSTYYIIFGVYKIR